MPGLKPPVLGRKALPLLFLSTFLISMGTATAQTAPNPSAKIANDELLKNFMAGMTYQPQSVALPPDPEISGQSTIFPFLPSEAIPSATDADATLQVPKVLQQK